MVRRNEGLRAPATTFTSTILPTRISSFWKSSIVAFMPIRGLPGFRRGQLQDDDALAELLDVDQVERATAFLVREEPRTRSQHDGVNHEPVHIDQVLAHQRIEELPAAGKQQVLAGLLLELTDRLHEVAAQHRCAAPCRV